MLIINPLRVFVKVKSRVINLLVAHTNMQKIPVAISQCLLGDPVRFDGGHKHNSYITEVLGVFLALRPVCPEVAIGLGVPRKPIRLVANVKETRVRGVADARMDVTAELAAQAEVVCASGDICGHIFMQNSPSCGVFGVKRFTAAGHLLDQKGRGAYARAITERLPLLPVEEAGRLSDPMVCENFLTRVFAYHDWQSRVGSAPAGEKLADFYARYRYLVMAHQPSASETLDEQLASLSMVADLDQARDDFFSVLMEALRHTATRANTTRVLQAIYARLKHHLQDAEDEQLERLIAAYQHGAEPLSVPLNRLEIHLTKIDDADLAQQVFWAPFPQALGLRDKIHPF